MKWKKCSVIEMVISILTSRFRAHVIRSAPKKISGHVT